MFLHSFRSGGGLFRRCYSSSNYREDLLSRTREIFTAQEASQSLQSIRPGSVIGLDIEGHHQIQLLQLRDESKNVFIYRISSNPKLLSLLSPILEDPDITKVIHQGHKDVFSLYRAGIRPWGLFDTSIGHKVYLYQSRGLSLFGKDTISYARLCEYHGYEVLKTNGFERSHGKGPLEEDYRLYCAMDADHLLDLHLVINSLLDPDFKSLLKDLSEKEILRVLDPELNPLLSGRNRSSDKNNLFLSQLPPSIANPFFIHELLQGVPGMRSLRFSHTYNNLHILFEKRSSAIKSKFMLEKKFSSLRVSLLVPLQPNRKVTFISFDESHQIPQLVKILCDNLGEFPLMMDFGITPSLNESTLFLDILPVPQSPPVRIHLSQDAVLSLRPLFESASITKVVFNMANCEYGKALKLLRSFGVAPKGMTDLMSAYKLALYSSFQANPFSINFISRKEFISTLGLNDETLESNLFAYLYLSRRVLPPRISEFLGALSKLDSDIYSSPDDETLQTREVKGRLKNRLLYESVAIQSEQMKGSQLLVALKEALSPLGSPDVRLLRDSLALAEFHNAQSAANAPNLLPPFCSVLPWRKTLSTKDYSLPQVPTSDIQTQIIDPASQSLTSAGITALMDAANDLTVEENIALDAFI